MYQKIGLGTVQFGLNYGVTNKRGKIPKDEIITILELSKENGITLLDTASLYGESEDLLGEIGVREFKVYSKLPKFESDLKKIDNWIYEKIKLSLNKIKIDSLEGLYLHDPTALHSEYSSELYSSLMKYKNEGLFKKLGLSIYSPNDYLSIQNKFPVELLQFPLNIFDQRFLSSTILHDWKSLGIEIQVRSIFLQGILLKNFKSLPEYFSRWESLFFAKETWRKKISLDLLSSCLYPILSNSMIDYVLVGVDSLKNFNEIISSIKEYVETELPTNLATNDSDLIFPYNWILH